MATMRYVTLLAATASLGVLAPVAMGETPWLASEQPLQLAALNVTEGEAGGDFKTPNTAIAAPAPEAGTAAVDRGAPGLIAGWLRAASRDFKERVIDPMSTTADARRGTLVRIAQAGKTAAQKSIEPKAGDTAPNGADVMAPVTNWLEQSARDFQGIVIKRLSVPTAGAPADPKADAVKGAETGTGKGETGKTAEASKPGSAPTASGGGSPGAAPTDGIAGQVNSVIDKLQNWLNDTRRDFQKDVVKKLEQPQDGVAQQPSAATEARKDAGKAASDKVAADKVTDKAAAEKAAADKAADDAAMRAAEDAANKKLKEADGKADAAAKAEERKKKEAEQKRLVEEKKAADEAARKKKEADAAARKAEEKRLADEKKAAEDKRLADEKRIAEEKRAAEAKKAAEDKRIAEEKRAEDAKKAAEDKRIADEKRAADARKAAEDKRIAEEKRAADAKKAAEDKRIAEEKRAADAKKAAEDKRLASEAAAKATAAAAAAKLADEASRKADEIMKSAGGAAGKADASSGQAAGSSSPASVAIASAASRRADAPQHRSGKRHASRPHSCRAAGRRVKPPAVYVVARGDTLWDISRRHYRRGARYPAIFRANDDKIRDPDLIFPCQRFYLPKLR